MQGVTTKTVKVDLRWIWFSHFHFGLVFKIFMIRLKSRQRAELRQKLPHLQWGPHSLLFNGYRDSVQKVMQPEREVDQSSPSSVKIIDWMISIWVRALAVPMHLRLPIMLYQFKGALFLRWSSRWPPVSRLIMSGTMPLHVFVAWTGICYSFTFTYHRNEGSK